VRLWGWPLLLGALSLFGLVAGLLDDGWWDWACWAGLASAVAALGWAWSRRQRARVTRP
jgi:hypothetical protein